MLWTSCKLRLATTSVERPEGCQMIKFEPTGFGIVRFCNTYLPTRWAMMENLPASGPKAYWGRQGCLPGFDFSSRFSALYSYADGSGPPRCFFPWGYFDLMISRAGFQTEAGPKFYTRLTAVTWNCNGTRWPIPEPPSGPGLSSQDHPGLAAWMP